MKISSTGLDLIKHFESFSPVPYLCPAHKLTVGYGHVVLRNENFTSITEEEATQLLQKDCGVAEDCINQSVKVPLSQDQFDALVSFVFNIGVGAFLNSTLLKLLNAHCYQDAALEFLRWNKSNGSVLNGLTRRRQAERCLFLTGSNQ
jgi:lysozyme